VIERNDIKNYAKQVIRSTLVEVAKVDHAIDFRRIEEEEKMMSEKMLKLSNKESMKSQNEIPIKVKSSQTDKKSKICQYSEGLRQFDEKVRKNTIVKKKYKNCASDELLAHLGINEEINFPCFSCSTNEDMKI
jgi:hypothetical protein